MRIGINAIWLDCQKARGAWHYLMYLLNGINTQNLYSYEFVILVSSNNLNYFKRLNLNNKFTLKVSNLKVRNKLFILIYQFIIMPILVKKYGIDMLFNPSAVYPIRKIGVPIVTTIHDLQYLYYPNNTSWLTLQKYKMCWRTAVKSSDMIVTISNSVKVEILTNYSEISDENVKVIYNGVPPIPQGVSISFLRNYGLEENGYLYSISSYAEHKNYLLLVKIIEEIDLTSNCRLPAIIVVTGINSSEAPQMVDAVKKMRGNGKVIFTPYISELEKHSLIRYCHSYVHTSSYEGFGLPLVEAMIHKKHVVCADLPVCREITQNGGSYVKNSEDVTEWISKLEDTVGWHDEFDGDDYSSSVTARKYLDLFETCMEPEIKSNLEVPEL